MRTTHGKPVHDRILIGERDLAARLGDALAETDPVDRGTHGFHTYPAGLHADAARDLIACFPARSVLDPFCGGGTVLVEGRIAGLETFGRDVSPTALRVARARTTTLDDEALTAFRSAARKLTAEAREATEDPPRAVVQAIGGWYAPHVLHELHALRAGLEAYDGVTRRLLEATLSSILVKVSWRKSDTSGQRVRHRRPRGTTAVLFHKKARELARRIVALRDLVPEGTPASDVRPGDAREIRAPHPVDLVLTSPPYPATYDYVPMQHLRAVWFGDDPRPAVRDELGSRRDWRGGEREARRRWRRDTNYWTRSAAEILAPGGHLVVVIGDGITPGGFIDTSEPTEQAAKAAGLVSVARASLERPDFARGRARWEHVFAFRKA